MLASLSVTDYKSLDPYLKNLTFWRLRSVPSWLNLLPTTVSFLFCINGISDQPHQALIQTQSSNFSWTSLIVYTNFVYSYIYFLVYIIIISVTVDLKFFPSHTRCKGIWQYGEKNAMHVGFRKDLEHVL